MTHILTDAQIDLFDAGRWPRRPYCTDDLSAGLRIRSLQQALGKRYIQANPPHLRVWSIFDVDRPAGGLAWEDAALPPPAWSSVNRQNGHAHLVWGLSAPVLTGCAAARDAPLRYLCAIESAMRERLQADPGFAGLITKNPAHPDWWTLRGPQSAREYDLAYLAEWIPDIDLHKRRGPVEHVGLGRNVTLFDALRKWAYAAIRQYRGGGLQAWNAWLSACNTRALVYNGDLFGGRLLDGREVWHIAKSVAKWVWRNFSAEKFSAIQSARRQNKGLEKWAQSIR